MEHYDDTDGLVEYGSEEIPGTTPVVNPAWRTLDKQVKILATRLRKHRAARRPPRLIQTTAKVSLSGPPS
ncbi:MAG: hypothetical protein U1F77_19275 [Kiritimatiellia bacterium]